MPLVSMRQLLLDHAAENGYGLPAFNVNNLEQIQAIMEAAEETGSPVIMQGSAGARKYAGEPYLRHFDRSSDCDVSEYLDREHQITVPAHRFAFSRCGPVSPA